MKNMIRAFVVVLALAGAASTHLSGMTSSRSAQLAPMKASSFPIPSCPPDDPNGCGMGTIVSAR